jgi:hypothetical protein
MHGLTHFWGLLIVVVDVVDESARYAGINLCGWKSLGGKPSPCLTSTFELDFGVGQQLSRRAMGLDAPRDRRIADTDATPATTAVTSRWATLLSLHSRVALRAVALHPSPILPLFLGSLVQCNAVMC